MEGEDRKGEKVGMEHEDRRVEEIGMEDKDSSENEIWGLKVKIGVVKNV